MQCDGSYNDRLRIETVATHKHPQDSQMQLRTTIAYFREPSAGEGIANARLGAAAPELLALAKKYASECAECGGRGFNTQAGEPFTPEASNNEVIPCDDCADIRAVIAKAEGRS